jgi:hypothetical protein
LHRKSFLAISRSFRQCRHLSGRFLFWHCLHGSSLLMVWTPPHGIAVPR